MTHKFRAALAPVHLGYAVGSGEPVAIPIGHLCVTGQTQQAGKTTALEALIVRSGLRSVSFITKRGEQSFRTGHMIAPYFRERADWQFVASLIDATMGEKNKLLRSFLMKVCRGAETLADVQRNVIAAKGSSRGFSESIYTEIEGYLDLVVPQLRELPPSRHFTLGDGLNVIDLTAYRVELQGLVIRSVLEHVYTHETDVVTVIPEAWEFLPEQRGSPVRLAFETLVRKGAALRNFVWIDSQDLAGVWKLAIRACPVFLVGVQREANEIKRTLANIPASVAKPTAADVATLELGQFLACWSRNAIRTYVQPAWMTKDLARKVATGAIDLRNANAIATAGNVTRAARQVLGPRISEDLARALAPPRKGEPNVTKAEAADLQRQIAALKTENEDLRRQLLIANAHRGPTNDPPAPRKLVTAEATVDDAIYEGVKTRLLADAELAGALLRLRETRPELVVTVERTTITIDGTQLKGRVARLIADGFFDEGAAAGAVRKELKRTGRDVNDGSLWRVLRELVAERFLTLEGSTYRLAPGAKVRVEEP